MVSGTVQSVGEGSIGRDIAVGGTVDVDKGVGTSRGFDNNNQRSWAELVQAVHGISAEEEYRVVTRQRRRTNIMVCRTKTTGADSKVNGAPTRGVTLRGEAP